MLLIDVKKLERLMEEMANAPKEDFGKRQPGEKCMYELQRKERYELWWKETKDSFKERKLV